MKSKTQVKYGCVIILLGLLLSSSPNYMHLSQAQQSALVIENPTSYFALAAIFNMQPQRAEPSLLTTIADLHQPLWEFERIQRTLRGGSMANVKLYLLDAWPRLNAVQRRELLHKMATLGAYDVLSTLSERYNLPPVFSTLLAIWQGKPVKTFSNNPYLQPFQLVEQAQAGDSACRFKLALIGSDLVDLTHLQALKSAFEARPEPAEKVYCLSQPIYVADKLDCTTNQGFAMCDLALNSAFAGYDYLVLMAGDGLANVSDKQMTLTHASTYNTFVHELMHFSGFEDEYPIPVNKAKWLCATSGKKAPNLYVGEQAPNNWVLSRTCEHGKLPSYKPNKAHSLLEYQSIKLDENYRKRWLSVLKSGSAADKAIVNSAE
ncbi:hypothetical protein [Pseudoalteromonas piscicida]|uniref:hypothetical protein n=1 Tax=Pseudoalteromonas piscicida TaxID=43662 RepID=UPI0030A2F2DE